MSKPISMDEQENCLNLNEEYNPDEEGNLYSSSTSNGEDRVEDTTEHAKQRKQAELDAHGEQLRMKLMEARKELYATMREKEKKNKGRKRKQKSDQPLQPSRRSTRIANAGGGVGACQEDNGLDLMETGHEENHDQNVDVDPVDSGPVKKRGRGPLLLHKHWNIEEAEKKKINFNARGQPIGPEVQEMMQSLSTQVRRNRLSLAFRDWRKVPCIDADGNETEKEKIWIDMKEKYNLDDTRKDFVLRSAGKKARDWRNELKRDHFDTAESFEMALHEVLEGVD